MRCSALLVLVIAFLGDAATPPDTELDYVPGSPHVGSNLSAEGRPLSIISTVELADGTRVRHGLEVDLDENGVIRAHVNWRLGEMVVVTEYYPNAVTFRTRYRQDEGTTFVAVYDALGQIALKGFERDGVPWDGEFLVITNPPGTYGPPHPNLVTMKQGEVSSRRTFPFDRLRLPADIPPEDLPEIGWP